MSLDKAIQFGKEKRKPYYGSKAFDRTCRNHGGCPACHGNRLYKYHKKLCMMEDKERDYERR